MVPYKIYVMILFISLSELEFTDCRTPASLDKTFHKGLVAYSTERWSMCIEKFEEALHLYKLYKSIVINCRINCNEQVYESQIKEDIDDLKIYEKYFNKRDCLNKCQDKEFLNVHLNKSIDESVLHNMQAKKPYEYLHICYFQQRMFFQAASAAYTYLVANPDDETMQTNMHYYLQQPEVDPNEIVDMESEDYVVMYKLGKKSYKQDNWAETVASMEEVIKGYFASENNCRVECEHLPGQEWSEEFVITMSNNIASLLHCRQQCQDKLKFLKYNSGAEFIADVLNYIQVSYYHLEKYADAAEAVGSYLVLLPDDEDMLQNVQFYKKHVEEKSFVPRTEVVHYLKRDTYEKNILHFFHQGLKHDVDFNTILKSYNFLK